MKEEINLLQYVVSCHVSVKYLELRFNRATRLLGTVFFILQAVSKKQVNT